MGSAADVCATHDSGPAYRGADDLPPFLRPLLAGLDTADPFELDARLRRAVRLEQRLDTELAPLLRQVTAPTSPLLWPRNE